MNKIIFIIFLVVNVKLVNRIIPCLRLYFVVADNQTFMLKLNVHTLLKSCILENFTQTKLSFIHSGHEKFINLSVKLCLNKKYKNYLNKLHKIHCDICYKHIRAYDVFGTESCHKKMFIRFKH